jgi:membrane associated rhomboid family serine protease
MGDVYRFPGGEMPPDFETKMPADIEVKHCYRHQDRETGVSCSNCGRPICHECMIPAAVGFRCPECMKEQGGRDSRAKVVTRGQIRSGWGAGAMGGPTGLSATKVLVVLNVAIFLLGLFPSLGTWLEQHGALYGPLVLAQHEYWRMFTSLFLHSGILHIAFNMWALWIVGGFMEQVVGRTKFVILYFVSGFAGSVLVLVAAPDVVVVGASGAIFGVFGALAVHAFLNRGRDFQSRSLLGNVLFLLVINLVFSFTGGISWQAHIGGLIGGAATMLAMMLGGRKDPRRPFELPDGLAVLGIVFLLVVITAWQVLTFTG